jgi:thymidylate synthase (FAD)
VKVYIIGMTQPRLLHPTPDAPYGMPGRALKSEFEKRHGMHIDDRGYQVMGDSVNAGEALIEFAGRLCYESFDLPNEKTRENGAYIQNIVSLGHESVLEHVSVTFYVEGVSRNLTHELIRHRHLSFSELSQRFVDMGDGKFISPPAMGGGESDLWHWAQDYADTVEHLKAQGKTRKQAREAARSYLPSGVETKFVVTGNLRAWRDVLKKRDSEHADAEMQLFAKEVKRQLLKEYPDVFKDLDATGDSGETA